jgi:hypothetical protein
LSGAFAWEQVALARPIPGIALDFRFGYSGANASPGAKIGVLDPYANPTLGLGWRHTFDSRIVPDDPLTGELRLLQWNGGSSRSVGGASCEAGSANRNWPDARSWRDTSR